MLALVETRSQHARTGRSGYHGPDTYVAVQIVPHDVAPLRSLNRRHAVARGIVIIYCGEGYARHGGPRSQLGQALAYADLIVTAVHHPSPDALAQLCASDRIKISQVLTVVNHDGQSG